MNLNLKFILPKYPFNINYADSIVLMGSCFSDHIGNRLKRSKFKVLNNPLGITFNPVSLAHQLDYILFPDLISTRQLEENDGLWHHFDFHGIFSGIDKKEVLKEIKRNVLDTRQCLQNASFLFLTFGTGIVYKRKTTDRVVANNHKFPIDEFTRLHLNFEEINNSMQTVLKKLLDFNPDLKIIFTVSPVRYTKEGLVENQRSKANLILAVEQLTMNNKRYYFPSYELFMDVLRDYRYYGDDLVHPNHLGVNFVWEKFKHSFFSLETQEKEKEIERLIRSTEHRPIHPESKTHRNFLIKLKHQIEEFSKNNSSIDFTSELRKIASQLD